MRKRSSKMFANRDRPIGGVTVNKTTMAVQAGIWLVIHVITTCMPKINKNGQWPHAISNSTCMSLLNTVHILTMKDRMTMVVVTFGHSQYGGWTYSSLSSTGLRMVNFLLASSVLPRARMARLIFCSNWGRALC